MKQITRFGPFHTFVRRYKCLMMVGILLFVASAAGIVFSFYDHFVKKEPIAFSQVTHSRQEAYFSFSSLTEEFASSENSEPSQVNHYYLAFDEGQIRIVRLQNETYLKMGNILDYTAGKTQAIPEPIIVKGVSNTIPEELIEFVRQDYQKMLKTPMTTEEIKEFLGPYMFVERQISSFLLGNYLFLLFTASVGLFIFSSNRYELKYLKKALNEMDEEGLLERLEKNFQQAKVYDRFSILCNDDLVMCYAKPLFLIPIDTIQEVNILTPDKSLSSQLCIEITVKDQWPSLILVRNNKKSIEQMDNLVNQIKRVQQEQATIQNKKVME